MNRLIRRKLIKAKRPPRSIEQWYKCATNLNQYWKKGKEEEERLRSKKKGRSQEQKQTGTANNQGRFRLYLILPQIWPRRQKEQQMPAKLTLIEEIERTNAIVARNSS